MIIRQLPATDMLRRLPAIMETKHRLRIDVLVHCHDIMVHALGHLRALCMAVDPDEVSPPMAAMIFADAWSIVDQVDLVRQAMAAIPSLETQRSAAFLDHAAQARLMRNAMDHLSQRIPNIANRNGVSEALFGSLSFVRCDDEQLALALPGEEVECCLVILARGTASGFDAAAAQAAGPRDIDSTVSNVRLGVAGASLALDVACADLTAILTSLSDSVSASIDAEIAQLEAESGVSESDLRTPAPVIVGVSTRFMTAFRPTRVAEEL
jgi:hypothetical protein